jgi:vacuolar-type H+-ATPase subunit H
VTAPRNDGPPRPEGDLARLLKTEAQLDEALRRAQEEAAALVAAARTKAAEHEAALGAEIEAETKKLEAEVTSDRGRREAEVSESTTRGVRAFEGVTADQVEVLARYVVARVIGTPP